MFFSATMPNANTATVARLALGENTMSNKKAKKVVNNPLMRTINLFEVPNKSSDDVAPIVNQIASKAKVVRSKPVVNQVAEPELWIKIDFNLKEDERKLVSDYIQAIHGIMNFTGETALEIIQKNKIDIRRLIRIVNKIKNMLNNEMIKTKIVK